MTEYAEGTEVAGRFVIKDQIGEGGMGAVYRAVQTSLDREVALKVLHSTVAFTPRARRRFGREARAVARLNHPHIAAVYDFGADNDDQTLWLAMELIQGRGMTHLKRSDVDPLRLLSITDQILSALSAAHARGIIHRDMKPSNVLLSANDEGREIIKLVDFGLAATQSGDLSLENAPGGIGDEQSETNRRVIMGTPRYMAPEIFRRQPVDPRVDLYALGVILFEILAGQPPYPGDDPKTVMKGHLKGPIPQLEAREGINIPPALERVIYQLLAKEADERFQTATEVREAIQAIINEYSYVPWVTGPQVGSISSFGPSGNMSAAGFLSSFGGQTIPPATLAGGTTSRPGGGIGSTTAPLVGRANERRAIEKLIRRAVGDGEGGIVLIEGEAGIGKSRLTEWLRVRVEESGVMRTASGQYTRSGGGFDGVRSVLDEVLGTSDVTYDDIERVVSARLERWDDFAREEIETASQLLRPGGDVSLFEGTGPAEDRHVSKQERVFAVVERILRRAARERPLLILLEDLHLAGETTFAFLEHLAVGLHLNPDPILIVSTLRSEDVDVVPSLREALERLTRFGSEILTIKLERLTDEEAATLVSKLFPVEPELAERIAERSGGNPLHLSQILRYLRESGHLDFQDGRWRLAEDFDLRREIPDELGDLMRYRADQVCVRYHDGEALRDILERAAILGERFDYRLLRGFVEAEEGAPYADKLDEALEYLVKESVLREVGHSAEDILEFHHAVMRDVLLQDLESQRNLRDVHRLAAEVKGAFYGGRARQHALEIAEHYRRARDPQGVYIYTVKAAETAMASSDLKTAIRLYREAQELAENEDQLDERVEEQEGLLETSRVLRSTEVNLEVANLELKLGEYDSAREHYRGLLRSDNQPVAGWARWGLGELARRRGELDEAGGWFEAARREADDMEGTLHEPMGRRIDAHSLFGLGSISYLRGELKAATETLTEALNRAQKQHDRRLEADILRTLAATVWSLGDANRAEVYRRRATILAESLDDQEALANVALDQARYLRQLGQPARATEEATKAREKFEEIGKRHSVAQTMRVLGDIALGRGDYKEAAKQLREAHRLFEAYDDRRGITHCKYQLARLAFAIKKHRETRTLVRDALEGYRSMGDRLGEAKCRLLIGRLELNSGGTDQAIATFARVAGELDELGDLRRTLMAHALLLVARLRDGEDVDSDVAELIGKLDGTPVVEEPLASALDVLCEDVNERRPDLALEIDATAEEIWQLLGRPVRVAT